MEKLKSGQARLCNRVIWFWKDKDNDASITMCWIFKWRLNSITEDVLIVDLDIDNSTATGEDENNAECSSRCINLIP